jgi:plastocyanin
MTRVCILVPAVLLLAACGGGSGKESSSSPAGPPLRTISLSEKEFSIAPAAVSLSKTGTYAFKVTNDGSVTHALEVEGNGVEQKTGSIDPGSSATLTVTLSKTGSYEVYCPIDGHKDKGMEISLSVGGGAATSTGETTTGQTTTTRPPGY